MSSDNCENKVTVYHEDPKVIERIIKAYERGTLLDEFTEEDVETGSISLTVISPNKIGLFMCTSWAPPHPILDQWVDLGCTVCWYFSSRANGTWVSTKTRCFGTFGTTSAKQPMGVT